MSDYPQFSIKFSDNRMYLRVQLHCDNFTVDSLRVRIEDSILENTKMKDLLKQMEKLEEKLNMETN